MKHVRQIVQEAIQRGERGTPVVVIIKSGRGCHSQRESGTLAAGLERVARLAVLGKNVTVCARIDFASALVAANVPNTRDSVTVLTLIESGAAAAVVEVDDGIDTFVVTTNQTRDRASRKTLGARSDIAGAVLTLLEVNALVLAIATIALTAVVLVIVTVLVGLSGGFRWSRGLGGGRSRRRLVATEGTGRPLPVPGTLGGREVLRGLVGSTAALSSVPRPIEGAILVGRWFGGIAGSSLGKTEVFGDPLEFALSTGVVIAAPAGENEGNGQNQEEDASNERHF